ncbi:hypothetical protein DFH06DRAFT_1220882, partial [Mycena polygramma]
MFFGTLMLSPFPLLSSGIHVSTWRLSMGLQGLKFKQCLRVLFSSSCRNDHFFHQTFTNSRRSRAKALLPDSFSDWKVATILPRPRDISINSKSRDRLVPIPS